MGDVNVLDVMPMEAGAFYVMDRGYLDFSRLYKMHQAGAFFVTRAKRGMDARRVYSAPNDRNSGVVCDQRIGLNGFYPSRGYSEHLRRIRFKDEELKKTLVVPKASPALALGKRRLHADSRISRRLALYCHAIDEQGVTPSRSPSTVNVFRLTFITRPTIGRPKAPSRSPSPLRQALHCARCPCVRLVLDVCCLTRGKTVQPTLIRALPRQNPRITVISEIIWNAVLAAGDTPERSLQNERAHRSITYHTQAL
jgi:hypothetical protein